jgi:hypothetical protein
MSRHSRAIRQHCIASCRPVSDSPLREKATSSKLSKGTNVVSGKKVSVACNSRHPANVPERARGLRAVSSDIYQIVVTCRDENEQKKLFQQLRKKHRVRLLVL